jgi:uncharacterized membrane protein YjjP (DUF1212 family)
VVLEESPSRRPQTFGGAVYLVVVGMALAGVAVAAAGPWRTGVSWMGASLLVGAVSRLVLPEQRAGMLRVRRRKVSDVVMLAVAGLTLIVLAVVVPNQPGG